MNVIETHQITKSYGKNDVVKGITLDVKRGEVFGFLGKNGAGKSTFINTLTGIIHPTSGEYFLFGEKGTHDQLKQRIGVMPDYVTFYSSWSPIRHLQLLSALSGKPVTKSQCLDTLKKVGLEKHANKKTSKFSFGMKKKLGIALAIIHDPELIFLDEPTSGLDAESVIMIQKLIQQLQSSGKTIFMTSHNLDEVEKICTRMAIMKDGEIVQIGTINELRDYYRSTITVKVKHSAIPGNEKVNLYEWLDSTGTDLESADNHFKMCVSSEKKIADIIRALNTLKVDILRVEVEEPSLEEMFLEA